MAKKLFGIPLIMLAGALSIGSRNYLEEEVIPISPASVEYFEDDNLQRNPSEIIGVRSKSMRKDLSVLEKRIVDNVEKMNLPDYIDRVFIRAQISTESSDNPNARGWSGERGYMQLTREAWNDVEKRLSFDEWAFDPNKNISVGIKYLVYLGNMLQQFHPKWEELSTIEKRRVLLSAYNSGMGSLSDSSWNLENIPRITKYYIKEIEGRIPKLLF